MSMYKQFKAGNSRMNVSGSFKDIFRPGVFPAHVDQNFGWSMYLYFRGPIPAGSSDIRSPILQEICEPKTI